MAKSKNFGGPLRAALFFALALAVAPLAAPLPSDAGETSPALPMDDVPAVRAPVPNAPAPPGEIVPAPSAPTGEKALDTAPQARPPAATPPPSESAPPRRKAKQHEKLPVPAYVKNELCVQCHPREAQQWATSHHFKAMAPAREDTVLGDFNDASFTRHGVVTRFFRRGGKFFVNTEGPDGKPADFEIRYTFGVDPLQQYLIELPRGKIQSFTIAWDAQQKRWFDLYPNEKTPAGDVLHWTGRYQNWNSMCASCHTTNLRRNYDVARDAYSTTWSEINVSCQSCHGPAEKHVAWAQSDHEPPAEEVVPTPERKHKKRRHRGSRPRHDGLRVSFGDDDATGEVELCAACHSRRTELSASPVPGDPLLDDYLPSLLTEDLYHADGQQKDEVYVYGSYAQSKMYRAGVRCSDCHDPHTATLRGQGNAVCTQCHQPNPDTMRFPTLTAKDYDSQAHHFHAPGAPGSACVDCHMPENSYMTIDARRDHAIRAPRPDLSVKLGVPNPCAKCHADQTAQWAADAITRWYPSALRKQHYGEILAAGRAGRVDAEDELAELVTSAEHPAIIRATALDLLSRYGAPSMPASIRGAYDGDAAVRAAAATSLERTLPQQRLRLAAPLLQDPIRAVRIEAARILSSVPSNAFDTTQRAAYTAARREYVDAQSVSFESPGAHLNLAVVYANEGDVNRAEQEYHAALVLDPDFTPARLNLAQLLNGAQRNPDAERVLRDGIARIPRQGELHYSLGLLLAEEKNVAEAAAELAKAAELLPESARVRYNLALALQGLGKSAEAETALKDAQEIDPQDPEIVYALTLLYLQANDWTRALATAQQLSAIMPDNADVKGLIEDIRRRATEQ